MTSKSSAIPYSAHPGGRRDPYWTAAWTRLAPGRADEPQTIIVIGSSISALNAARKRAPVAPSTTR